MLELLTRHPRSVGETYGEHLTAATSFGTALIAAGVGCFVHGLLPFLFERTGSQCVARLHEVMESRAAPPGQIRA